MIADSEYIQWLSDVKKRFRQSQGRALVKVNAEMLDFYWSIGRDLVMLKAEARWGDGVVKQFAFDMREAFPEASGFSYSNVKYMKQWYLFYNQQLEKSQRPVGLFENKDEYSQLEKSQRPIGFLPMPEMFGRIPWGHHIDIVSRSTTLDEALFYAKYQQTAWRRDIPIRGSSRTNCERN